VPQNFKIINNVQKCVLKIIPLLKEQQLPPAEEPEEPEMLEMPEMPERPETP